MSNKENNKTNENVEDVKPVETENKKVETENKKVETENKKVETENKKVEKRTKVRIPRDPFMNKAEDLKDLKNNKPVDDSVPVQVNGKIYQIQRGVEVEVPQVVADILEESGYLR